MANKLMAIRRHVMRRMLKNPLGLVLLIVFAEGDAGWGSTFEALPAAEALRVIKSERNLYLLRGGKPRKVYGISLSRRPVGVKVQAGDKRTPEGRYVIDGRNLGSRYHRALHISYPDARDSQEACERGVDPGGIRLIYQIIWTPRPSGVTRRTSPAISMACREWRRRKAIFTRLPGGSVRAGSMNIPSALRLRTRPSHAPFASSRRADVAYVMRGDWRRSSISHHYSNLVARSERSERSPFSRLTWA